jgi:hypothetical protein
LIRGAHNPRNIAHSALALPTLSGSAEILRSHRQWQFGTAVHLAEVLFMQKAGVEMVHVPYRGTVTAMPDLLTGRIAMMIDGVPVQTENIRKGTVRALAVTTSRRSPSIPDVPAMKEAGLDYEVPFWTAIYVPSQDAEANHRKACSRHRQSHARGGSGQAPRRCWNRGGGFRPGRARSFDPPAVRSLPGNRAEQ